MNSPCYDQIRVTIVIHFTKRAVHLLPATANEYYTAEKDVAFKNNAPFRSCLSKINNTLIGNKKHLDIAKPMHNLLEHINNYSMISESL